MVPAEAHSGAKGAIAAPVSRGTIIPLSLTKNMLPYRLWASNGDNFFSKSHACVCAPDQPAHLLSLYGIPARLLKG